MKSLIEEYCLLNSKRSQKRDIRKREIEEELCIFELGDNFIVSGGTKIVLSLIQWLADGNRNKFIKLQEAKIKNKNYPAQSWINSTKKIIDFEKKHKVRFSYDTDTDEISFLQINKRK